MLALDRINVSGYGYVRTDGLLRPAHRVAYELVVGPIPEGLHLDHLCRQAVCCNPAHLEPVELRENTARGEHPSSTALRTNFCIHGHEYTPDNTYVWHGRRQCRECRRRSRRESARRAYRRRKDSSP